MPHRDEKSQLNERQRGIVADVTANGFATIENLADSFGVSAQTIRRDIIALDKLGLLQRFHGGAGIGTDPNAVRLGHSVRQHIASDDKITIGNKAAAIIPEGSTVFMDVGTTVEAAAQCLAEKEGLTIFTNSTRVASFFDPYSTQVYVLGGRLAGGDGSLVGESVVNAIAKYRFDYALIGCQGIEPEGAVMDFDLAKIAVKKAAIKRSRFSMLLANEKKFGRSALCQVATLEDFAYVVTNREEDE
ncbi:DeoR/GlpR transcriptional regulator [Rhodobacteraceae bacterium RKSG542]|uniref:DeoR/GlpR family DNA-binding transcription regulator n=1 Tax=Pseudovibrio flavus TaxID=2529854 RepID=UPI0012BC1DC3|nr:DeoR/GlpR family DNA-binding transcription regulator [Pseudovibrio flavus]MTI15953.1 DeoR/GlpR transcriptional regulator [Pseudovibrio flavus]